jgi:hypothetical protein
MNRSFYLYKLPLYFGVITHLNKQFAILNFVHSNLLKSMDIFVNCAPDEAKKNINYLYLQKTFMILTESNEQTLIWQIAYLNGLLLQNKEATCKDKNFGSVNIIKVFCKYK